MRVKLVHILVSHSGQQVKHTVWCRYTTDASYKEFEQMRTSMEPLTYKHGVDVFFYGGFSLLLYPPCALTLQFVSQACANLQALQCGVAASCLYWFGWWTAGQQEHAWHAPADM